MLRRISLLVFIIYSNILVLADPGSSSGAQASPSSIQLERADKIANSLKLSDAGKIPRVQGLIARQYFNLSLVHAKRDESIKAAKAKDQDRAEIEAAIAQARADATAAQDKLHASFLAALGTELTATQIDAVKDGMTYGVLPLTFRVYQQMLPDLTAEQKSQILAWLTEAREYAMDASTSEEKHAWFGKYKGRINNYLVKAGYDLKTAEHIFRTARK
ncbi:MAG TPA: DUF3826 domain-containing protein [Opitutaceae bacterium]|nr:DUF3826 domain-containing protein [Opitutaceae bacterium]